VFPTPADLEDAALEAPTALIDRALQARRDLRATDAALEAAQADARAARASRLPQVAVSASIGTSYSSAGEIALPSQVSDNRAGSLRLSLSLPIMDRGVTRQRIRRAEAQASALRAERRDAQRAIALEIQELWIRFDALEAQTEIADLRIRAAQDALEAERARYDAGESTLQSVSLLQARAVEAEVARAQLDIEGRFQKLLLDLSIGE
ncbi:TolC family protein, partial [Rubrivirga sp.]|uniref:TolC family protein n=1 Tax=Rubrivirga sp. TaxID=1885344 RepID=UPI003C725F62